MKCPNQLCQHGIEGNPEYCPRCSVALPGAVLGDRFSLDRILRVTPFIIVYGGFDRQRSGDATIRVFVPRFGHAASGLKSEIKALKEMKFDQIPQIYDFDWDADFPWIAEEKVAGEPLVNRLVSRERPFTEQEVVQVMLETARTLEKMHTLHVIHRDIRPESLVYRDADNKIVLGPPGWEREFQERAAPKAKSIYLAPEMAPGRASPQADLYALGVTAIQLLTGLNPEGLFNPTTRNFQWQRAVKTTPRLAEVMDALVAETASDRIQTAGRLVQLLSAIERNVEAPSPLPAVMAATAGNLPDNPAMSRRAEEGPDLDSGGDERALVKAWGGFKHGKEHATPKERKLKRWIAVLWAALAAAIGGLLALWRRLAESRLLALAGPNGAKILAAVGIAAGGLFLSTKLLGPSAPLPSESIGGLPVPILGANDMGLAGIAELQGAEPIALPDPSILRKWIEATPPPPPPMPPQPMPRGFAYSAGGAPKLETIRAYALSALTPPAFLKKLGWPTSLAHGEDPAKEPHTQAAGRPGYDQPVKDQLGQAPPGEPVPLPPTQESESRSPETAAQPPAPEGRQTRSTPPPGAEALPAAPYDAIAEPGQNQRDASGLDKAPSPFFIRVNKTYKTLTLYKDGKYHSQFPITTGKNGATPDGRYTIQNKIVLPPYKGIPGGDPRNPLGTHWLGLDVSYPGGGAIGLHGTNGQGGNGDGMGLAESAGCVRLRNEDVSKLYQMIPTGTPVEII